MMPTIIANSSAEIKVREGSPADIPSMIALERDSAMAAHWREQDYVRIFTSDGPLRGSLVLEENGTLTGFIVVGNVGSEWELENILVAETAKRRGLGTRLMFEFLGLARERGATSVFLEVRESNRPARGLYEKWGFMEAGRRKGYYAEPTEDAIVYRLEFL
jgi:ribosomal-protein-alanine N-acetyltransferase